MRLQERNFYLYLLAAAVLAAGYVDLVRGGTTISAFLLSIAYCVLIPLAIWRSRPLDDKSSADTTPPSYGAAALVALAVLVLYLATLAPSTAMWDTSEYIAAAYTFGLPHPPGNPLFVIVGRMFSILPIAPTIAQRINVLAALSSAASAGLWFLVTEQVLGAWVSERWIRISGAVAGSVIGATAFTVWNQSVVNEKVYTVSLAGIALVSWLAIRWSNQPSGPRADRLLALMAYLCGLGYANHMAGMLPAPAIVLAILLRRPGVLLRPKLVVACLLALIVGLSPFATQPIRAAYFPALNEGEPTACRTTIALSCTMSGDTYRAFMYNFNRRQFGKPALSNRQASFPQQLGMWWLYFKWQWLRDPDMVAPFVQALFAATFLALGLIGGSIHYSRDRQTFWYFGALMFTTTLLLIYYLNFKLGASQDPLAPQEHEVRDRDYFFIWSFSAWGVWAALGLTYAWESGAALVGTRQRRVGKATVTEPTRRGWIAASPMLLLALVPLGGNWSSASRAHHTTTRNVAADLLNSVEPYGVLITVGDNDTFPLWYAQEVEGIRRDVVVANTSLLNTDWYVRQLIRRPIFDYDAVKGPTIYRNQRWPKPTLPPLHMTMADADAVPEYYELRGPMQFNSGPFHATIDPRNLQYGVLQRADAFVLRMIQDAWTERPIYFARSSAGYPRSLGLENNVLTQGLASKVFVPPAELSNDTVFVQGDGWLDVPRTKALWDSVFTGYRSVVAEAQWIDRPSASMPALYIFAGAELADALRMKGDIADANRVFATSRQVATAVRLDDLARALESSASAAPAAGDSTGVTLRVDRNAQPQTRSTEQTARKPKR